MVTYICINSLLADWIHQQVPYYSDTGGQQTSMSVKISWINGPRCRWRKSPCLLLDLLMVSFASRVSGLALSAIWVSFFALTNLEKGEKNQSGKQKH